MNLQHKNNFLATAFFLFFIFLGLFIPVSYGNFDLQYLEAQHPGCPSDYSPETYSYCTVDEDDCPDKECGTLELTGYIINVYYCVHNETGEDILIADAQTGESCSYTCDYGYCYTYRECEGTEVWQKGQTCVNNQCTGMDPYQVEDCADRGEYWQCVNGNCVEIIPPYCNLKANGKKEVIINEGETVTFKGEVAMTDGNYLYDFSTTVDDVSWDKSDDYYEVHYKCINACPDNCPVKNIVLHNATTNCTTSGCWFGTKQRYCRYHTDAEFSTQTTFYDAGEYTKKVKAENSKGIVCESTVKVTVLEPEEIKPSVTTLSATNISSSGGTLRGDLTAMGTENEADVYFEWAKSSSASLGNTTSSVTKSSTGTFNETLANLDYNTTYNYRAVATNDAGTAYGNILSFTTDDNAQLRPPSPFYASPNPFEGGKTGYMRFHDSPDDSRAGGAVDSVGYTTEIRYLDENKNPITAWDSTTTSFTSFSSSSYDYYRVSFTISSNQNYAYAQFRSKATHPDYYNSDWAYSDRYDIDHIVAPSVTTLSATNISSSGGTLRGDLTDMGNDTSVQVYFKWGKTTSLGNTTSSVTKSSTGNFSKTLSGLDHNTTYYYRAVATNDAGTAQGIIRSFTTDKIQLNPPDGYYCSSDLRGGETGYTRFYYSPSDSKVGGDVTGIGYVTEARYYNQSGNPLTNWGWTKSSFDNILDNYYRVSFTISSDIDYVQVKFRSKATHSDYYDSDWVYSDLEMVYHNPAKPGSFVSPTDSVNGGEEVLVDWNPSNHWGNPSTDKNYRLQVSYNGNAWEFLSKTGAISSYEYFIPADVSLETVRYRVRAESGGGQSSYRYSSVFDINHLPPEAINLDWNKEDHNYALFSGDCYGYCNSIAPATVTLSWDYYSEAGYTYDTADLQVSTVEGDFSSSNLKVNVTDIGNVNAYSIDTDSLDFNTKYYWRVRVSSENGYFSDWAYSDFQTDKERAYLDFDWSPKEPYLEESVDFENKTVPGDNASIANWYWQFESAEPANSTEFNPSVEFVDEYGSQEVVLQATDVDGVVCSMTKTISPRPELPDWEEVDPFE